MKLQILIPQYNEDDSIVKPLLDSLKNQICVDVKNDIGVIIINDGSKIYLSEDFLNSYPFEIKYIKSEHLGVSGIRNLLMDYATADYIMYCDADDRFYNMLGVWFILKEISKRPFDVMSSIFVGQKKDPETGDLIPFNIDSKDCTFVHGKVYRRNYLLANDIRWNEKLTVHEDSYFNVLARALTHNFIECKTPFYVWCYRPGSVTRSDNDFLYKTYNMYLDSREALVEKFLELGSEEAAQWEVITTVYQVYYRINNDKWFQTKYRTVVEKRFKKFYKKYKKLFDSCPNEVKLDAVKDIKNKSLNDGLMFEKILFDDWIKSI